MADRLAYLFMVNGGYAVRNGFIYNTSDGKPLEYKGRMICYPADIFDGNNDVIPFDVTKSSRLAYKFGNVHLILLQHNGVQFFCLLHKCSARASHKPGLFFFGNVIIAIHAKSKTAVWTSQIHIHFSFASLINSPQQIYALIDIPV